ncbi:MAG: glycosyltransferase [Armatimonadetes bacterium]|nr:glycosyltransferase [Armatimonadota bacterium]
MAGSEYHPTLLLPGPVPPPAFGVAKATKLLVESPILAAEMTVVHVDTSDVEGFASIGKLDWHNVRVGVSHLARLIRRLVKDRPDVMLLTISQGRFGLIRDALFVHAARVTRCRVVSYLRGSGYADVRAKQGRIAAWALRSIVDTSARTLVLGRSLVEMARAISPDARVAVVPNGCPPAVRADWVGTRHESHPVLVYLGWLSREKGVDDALIAARRVADSVPSLEFVLCGQWESAAYEEKMRSFVADYALSHVVSFPGPITGEQKEALLARAWALVVPSHSEGQPWVILEAMSAGVPVVATDTGAIAETVQDGTTGFVVPVGDHEILAKQLVTLLCEETVRRRFSQESTRRYQERFTVEHSHRALARELLQVAQGRGTLTDAIVTGTSAESESVVKSTGTWFSGYATEFDRQYAETFFFSERQRLWTRLIRESCPPGCRVLDAGCGSGAFSVVAAQNAVEVVAIDPSLEMLGICAERCACAGVTNCTRLESSIEALDSADLGLFDLLLASSVLEYVEDLRECLTVLARLSRPGATLIASLPNPTSTRRRIEKLSYRLSHRPEYYGLVRNLPKAPDFEALLTEAGFTPHASHLYGVSRLAHPFSRSHWIRRQAATMVAFVAKKA